METKGDRRDRKRISKRKIMDNRKSVWTILEIIKKRAKKINDKK